MHRKICFFIRKKILRKQFFYGNFYSDFIDSPNTHTKFIMWRLIRLFWLIHLDFALNKTISGE